MKKIIMAGLLLFLIFSWSTIALSETSNSNAVFGPGLGIPYGGIGGNFEIGFSDYFALCGGLGFTPGGLGKSIGARIYFAGKDSRVRPRLGYYQGTVGYADELDDYELVDGSASGFGLRFKINNKISIDGELIYINSWDYDGEPDSRYKISAGVRFHL